MVMIDTDMTEIWDQFSARLSANRKERILITTDWAERERLRAIDRACDATDAAASIIAQNRAAAESNINIESTEAI